MLDTSEASSTSRPSWARLAAVGLGLAAGAVACQAPRDTAERGAVLVVVTAPPAAASPSAGRPSALSLDLVQQVVLEVVPGTGGGAPITRDVSIASGQGEVQVTDLPVGTYTFLARALASDGTTLFSGETSGAIQAKQTLAVSLLLQQVPAPATFSSVAPRITSLVSSSASPRSGQALTLTVTATGADAGALSYAWESSCPGTPAASSSFSAPAAASTDLTSTCVGAATILCHVSDALGSTSTASLTVTYLPPDSAPSIQGFSPAAPQVVAGSSVAVSVGAADADGDPLSYAWTSDCGGTFSAADSAAVAFQAPPAVPASGACLLTVSVSDPYGATASGTVAVAVTPPTYTVSVTMASVSRYQYQCGSYICGSYSCNCFFSSCSTCYSYCPSYCWADVPFTVSSTPPGISCSLANTGQVSGACSASFPSGTSVTLSSSGTIFSGACGGSGSCTVVVTQPLDITATR